MTSPGADVPERSPTRTVWALRTDRTLEDVDLRLSVFAARGDGVAASVTVSEDADGTTLWLPVGVDPNDDGVAALLVCELGGCWDLVPVDGWDERWRATIAPVHVAGFVVTPPWKATGAPEEIVIEPAQAFGTGHHETTTGCLRALAACDLPGRSMLDVGTGTGILAIAAARLGAAPVLACDTDPVAAGTAQRNAAANGAPVTVVTGSLAALPADAVDVVVANLDTATVVALAGALVARCAGTLIVSGVSNERVGEALGALRAAGLVVTARPGREWAVLTGTPT